MGEVSIAEKGAPDQLPTQISRNHLSPTDSIRADIWTWSLANK